MWCWLEIIFANWNTWNHNNKVVDELNDFPVSDYLVIAIRQFFIACGKAISPFSRLAFLALIIELHASNTMTLMIYFLSCARIQT